MVHMNEDSSQTHNTARVLACRCPYAGLYFAAQPLQQRAVGWYMPFFLLPGSEEALKAHDWALFRLFERQNATEEQVEAYVNRLSEPGERVWLKPSL
jgi:hypothetical protein